MTTPTMTKSEPRQYDAVAADYDRLIRPKYDPIAALVVDRARELTDIRRAEVIELSAGTGALTHQLAPLVRAYIATDVSEPMLSIAREHDVSGTESVAWIAADMHDLPLPSASADLAVSSLGPFQDSDDALEEARRVLRPAGLLVAATWGDDYRELDLLQAARRQLDLPPRDTTSVSELSARLWRTGYRRVDVREVRLDVIHESVDSYLAYRQAFGPAPDSSTPEQDAALHALARSAESYTDESGRVVLDWHLLVMSAER
jgi:SAM-dependent methyltransferase